MKMQAQVIKEFLDCQAPLAEKDQGGLQDWDFLVHRDKGGSQEPQAAQARGALMVWRVGKVILNTLCDSVKWNHRRESGPLFWVKS